jgi:hypothetical protein
MTSKNIQLTKFEVSRRQLVTAIRLFFANEDSVSVCTLTHAAGQILDDLCKHQKKIRIRDQMAQANGTSVKNINDIIGYVRNFFKHADNDPEADLSDFSDIDNDHLLMITTCDFETLASTKPMEIQLFQLWYFAVHPDKAPMPNFREICRAGEELFPGILQMPRGQQKAAGQIKLSEFIQNPSLMKHEFTDQSDVGAI